MMENLLQFVPSETCFSCDGCCRFKEEESSWRPKVGQQERDLAARIFAKEALDHAGAIKTLRCQDGSHRCQFFSLEGNTCTIYAYRPFECRLYPFILMRAREEIVLAVHLNCPHIEQTRRSSGFKEYVAYLETFFRQEETKVFLKKNDSLIDTYASFQDELERLFTVSL